MRKCRFGARCRNIAKCRFEHSEGQVQQNKLCRFGSKCRYLGSCAFQHAPTDFTESRGEWEETSQAIQVRSEQRQNTTIDTQTNPIIEHSSFPFSVKQNARNNASPTLKPRRSSITPSIEDRLLYPDQVDSFDLGQDLNSLNELYLAQEQLEVKLQAKLEDFFNRRLISVKQFNKIVSYLKQKIYLNEQKYDDVLTLVEQLEIENQYVGEKFNYLHWVETIVKRNFDLRNILDKLHKEMVVKEKKQAKVHELLLKFPKQIDYAVLTDVELFERHTADPNRIYLIDGDNVLPSHKVFRRYYQSPYIDHYIQGQLRLRWLVSFLEGSELFYDRLHMQQGKEEEEGYWEICKDITHADEMERIRAQPCHYAKQEYLFEQNKRTMKSAKQEIGSGSEEESEEQQSHEKQEEERKADDLIVEHLIGCLQQEQQKMLVVITADKELIQKCLHMGQKYGRFVEISSGKPFVKMCKEMVRRKALGVKNLKGVLKRIFLEPRALESEESA